jgi:hypothetical protein
MEKNTDPGAEIRKKHLGSYFRELSENNLIIHNLKNCYSIQFYGSGAEKSGSGIKIPDPHHWKRVYIFWVWSGLHLIE